jgi:transposase InsO family protein
MTLDESLQGMRLQVIRRASEVGVSAACREAGISRTLFYRWQARLTQYGVEGLHPRRQRGRPGPGPELPPHAERQILALAIAQATWGCRRLASYLARWWRLTLAPSTVQRLLHRHGLGRRRERLLVLEHHSARQAGLLTERTRRALWHGRHGATRHVTADAPGELVCLDTFYIGKLKGVGKVWQITACDAASSFGVAAILPALTSEGAAAFLRAALVPLFRKAGWAIQRVLTDGGPEFKKAFAEACATLGIRHTRTKPRHAWTNGFVERLQQTILHEHWRVVFRRQYFTRRAVLHRTLQQFMRFYNFERPHHGYRTRGRTPASIVFGARAVGSLNS